MTQTMGPVRVWPSRVEAIQWSEDQPFLIIDLLSTNSAQTIERQVLLPMAVDDAWQLAILLQEALERQGIPRPKDMKVIDGEEEE